MSTLQGAPTDLRKGGVQTLPGSPIPGLKMTQDFRPIPDEIVRLAVKMFASHTGLSREQLLTLFGTLGVKIHDLADVSPRSAVFRECLSRIPAPRRLSALDSD